jgi:hypothetical protein
MALGKKLPYFFLLPEALGVLDCSYITPATAIM